MRVSRFRTMALLLLAAAALAAEARQAAAQNHPMVRPGELKWGPAPPVLPAGAQLAVLDGDPTKPGFFTIRLKFPDGYRIAPHTHPAIENVVVMSGTLLIGMGATRQDAAMHALPAGSFTSIPKASPHYAGAKGETVIQIYGQGPFVLEYVNPSDKPTQ